MHKKGFAVRDVVHNYYTVVVPVQHCMHSNIVKKMLGEKRGIYWHVFDLSSDLRKFKNNHEKAIIFDAPGPKALII